MPARYIFSFSKNKQKILSKSESTGETWKQNLKSVSVTKIKIYSSHFTPFFPQIIFFFPGFVINSNIHENIEVFWCKSANLKKLITYQHKPYRATLVLKYSAQQKKQKLDYSKLETAKQGMDERGGDGGVSLDLQGHGGPLER